MSSYTPIPGKTCDACGEPATKSKEDSFESYRLKDAYLCKVHWNANGDETEALIDAQRMIVKLSAEKVVKDRLVSGNRFQVAFEEIE